MSQLSQFAPSLSQRDTDLMAALQAETRRARAVADVALAMAQTASVITVVEAATASLAGAFDDGASAVWLHDPKTNQLHMAAAHGYTGTGLRQLATQSIDAQTTAAESFRCMDVVIYRSSDPDVPALTKQLFLASGRDQIAVAATPLMIAGRLLGVMTLIVREEPLSPAWVETLRAVGTQVGAAVERAHLYERESQIAARLQEALAPALEDDTLLQKTGLAIAHRYRPGTEGMTVGGDFYDVWPLVSLNGTSQRLAVALGDVSGKGLEAAVQTAAIRHAVQAYAHEDPTPATVIARVNAFTVAKDLLPNGFATMFFATIDASSGRLSYCSAGHESLLLYGHPSEKVEELHATAPALGLTASAEAIESRETILEIGGELVLYTDGITEARSPEDRRLLGVPGLISLLDMIYQSEPQSEPLSPTLLAATLLARVEEYAGGHLEDDAALLIISRPTPLALAASVASTVRTTIEA